MQKPPEGMLTVLVSDDGFGLPEGFDLTKDGGVGFKFISALAREIGATQDVRSDIPAISVGFGNHAMLRLAGILRLLSLWLFWPGLLLIVWGEHTPHPPDLGELFGWDKLEHFTVYFGLASMATMVIGLKPRLPLYNSGHHSAERIAGAAARVDRPRFRNL